MSWHKHVSFWITIWGMLLLAVPLLIPMEGQMARIKGELASTSKVFGEEKTDSIINAASSRYRALFIDTKILTEESKLYTKPVKAGDENKFGMQATKSFGAIVNGYLTSLSINVYGMLVRWEILIHWAIYILPFVLAAFLDGFIIRKIKFSEFGYISPTAYSVSLHGIIMIMFIPLLYLIAPLPITPYFMPGWAICLAIPIMVMVANTQRMFKS